MADADTRQLTPEQAAKLATAAQKYIDAQSRANEMWREVYRIQNAQSAATAQAERAGYEMQQLVNSFASPKPTRPQ